MDTRRMSFLLTTILLAAAWTSGAAQQSSSVADVTLSAASAPRLFFTDIESGPATGGQEGLGAFITIHGEGFGASRDASTVTIGGVEVARYVIWGQDNGVARELDMIVVQPGPQVRTGDLVVTVNGTASNALPFTVRDGMIYFVDPAAAHASDENPGTYEQPFRNLNRPRHVMQAGDIVYIRGGTFNVPDPDNPGWDAILLLTRDTDPNGSAERPVAYIGYPGTRPILRGDPPMRRGILVDQAMSYYVFANLEFTGAEAVLALSGVGHRAVGNFSHGSLNYAEGAVIGVSGNSSHIRIHGNLMQDNGGTDDGLAGHGLYIQGFGTNQFIDFGWNEIRDQRGRRAIQLYGHADGDRMDEIRIHDNVISGSMRDNILLGGSDGNNDVLGTIYVYNNIITGADWQGLRFNDPAGRAIIQNNVFHDNGAQGTDNKAQLFFERAAAGGVTLQNNIVFAQPGQSYYAFGAGANASSLVAANNLWFNDGPAPAWDTDPVNADPLFVDAGVGDFRIRRNSPAIDAGINTTVSHDFFGQARGPVYDIGVHEYTGTTGIDPAGPQALENIPWLQQNYPNPFDGATSIRFTLQARTHVTLKIFSITGQLLRTMVNADLPAGTHEIPYHGEGGRPGVYFYRLTAGDRTETRKFLIIR